MMRLDDGGVDVVLEHLETRVLAIRRAAVLHETALAGVGLDDALALELGVGLRDRVAVDAERLGERTDTGKAVAGAERAGCDGQLHLVDDLEVDGLAGRERDVKAHWRT